MLYEHHTPVVKARPTAHVQSREMVLRLDLVGAALVLLTGRDGGMLPKSSIICPLVRSKVVLEFFLPRVS
jgi:hypothetical protein